MPPITMDQKIAGFSRAAQRQYRNGVDQKCGAADIVLSTVSTSISVGLKGQDRGGVRN